MNPSFVVVRSSRWFLRVVCRDVRSDVIAGGDVVRPNGGDVALPNSGVDCARDVARAFGCDVLVRGRRLTSVASSISLRPPDGVIVICAFATSIIAFT